VVPEELVDLWQWMGGGVMFDSETILTPVPGQAVDDGVDDANKWLREHGPPDGYLVFHEGVSLSAVRQPDGVIVELDRGDFTEKSTFASVSDWYVRMIRANFAERYGLPPVRAGGQDA
jgi:hypothetical protein